MAAEHFEARGEQGESPWELTQEILSVRPCKSARTWLAFECLDDFAHRLNVEHFGLPEGAQDIHHVEAGYSEIVADLDEPLIVRQHRDEVFEAERENFGIHLGEQGARIAGADPLDRLMGSRRRGGERACLAELSSRGNDGAARAPLDLSEHAHGRDEWLPGGEEIGAPDASKARKDRRVEDGCLTEIRGIRSRGGRSRQKQRLANGNALSAS